METEITRRSPSTRKTPRSAPAHALTAARARALALQQRDGLWSFPVDLGTHCLSQYLVFLHWLGREDEADRLAARLAPRLLSEQLEDGSWYTVRDTNALRGELDPTVLNYWALKISGIAPDSPAMTRAREFIHLQGGIERTNFINQSILALFGNALWSDIPEVPYLLFSRLSPIRHSHFARWVGDHVRPLAYLRRLRVTKNLGQRFRLDELWSSPLRLARLEQLRDTCPRRPKLRDEYFLEKLVLEQQSGGSLGGYTLSTLYAAAALSHAGSDFEGPLESALGFVRRRYFDDTQGRGAGTFMDGRLWDTVLVGQALHEAGAPRESLLKAAEAALRFQNDEGGFGFGEDFLASADADCTAEAALFLRQFPELQEETGLALEWLVSHQNRDGGWGAFDVDNRERPGLSRLTARFSEIMELHDPSTACVTGHVLEALGTLGHHTGNSRAARRAVSFLKKSQEESGLWKGRWGVHYLYGTGAALVGLLRAGVSPQEPWMAKALEALERAQNPDGGFGESTRSYPEGRLIPGISTPTQTAWVLLALLEAGRLNSDSVRRAHSWLERSFTPGQGWSDGSVVGTAQPGLVYMEYPSYPLAFPLLALAKVRSLRAGS